MRTYQEKWNEEKDDEKVYHQTASEGASNQEALAQALRDYTELSRFIKEAYAEISEKLGSIRFSYSSGDSIREQQEEAKKKVNAYCQKARQQLCGKIHEKIRQMGRVPRLWPSSYLETLRCDDISLKLDVDYFLEDYQKYADVSQCSRRYRNLYSGLKQGFFDPEYAKMEAEREAQEKALEDARSQRDRNKDISKWGTVEETLKYLGIWLLLGGFVLYAEQYFLPELQLVPRGEVLKWIMVGTAILIGILSYLPSDLKFTRKMIREAKAELGNYDKQVQKEEAKLKALKTSTAYIAAKERENQLREADAQLAEQWHRAWWESCKAGQNK